MNSYIPFQSTFFYNGRWSPCVDKKLLSTMVCIKGDQKWEGQLIPEVVLVQSAETMKHDLGVEMSTDEPKLRLNTLKERYMTFNEIVSTRGATWDVHHNVIVASEEVWKKIFMGNEFSSL
ncbi:hypothetical protein AAHA92_06485 [Salvia divinorum]|uniref:Myb/SANT-like domain-containing protein n=1 Tax=Salvia divinorum TaxID=28513 RepID=A0ABD1I5T8_SALDI